MSKPEVCGVRLETLVDPVRASLARYSDATDGRVAFDLDKAAELELTPDMPNSARSKVPVRHLGELAGNLFVIVFAPEDGTGDESAYGVEELNFATSLSRSKRSKITPRSKAGAHSEVYLPIAAQDIEGKKAPVLNAGCLNLIGLSGNDVVELGTVGLKPSEFLDVFDPHIISIPRLSTTFTTGYGLGRLIDKGERFGDPHAIFNEWRFLQVAGFLAVSHEDAPQHLGMLHFLGAREPELIQPQT